MIPSITLQIVEEICICVTQHSHSSDIMGYLQPANLVPISGGIFLFEDQCLHKLVVLLCAAHFSEAHSQTVTTFFGAILQSACAHKLSHLWQRNKTCLRKLLRYLIIRLYIKTEYSWIK